MNIVALQLTVCLKILLLKVTHTNQQHYLNTLPTLLHSGFAFDQMGFNSILMGKASLHCLSLPSLVTGYISKRYLKR